MFPCKLPPVKFRLRIEHGLKQLCILFIFFIHMLRQPAVRTGDIKLLFSRHLEYGRNLGMKGCIAFIRRMGISQYRKRSVPAVPCRHFRRIWQIACSPGGNQVMSVFSHKMGRCFPYIRRIGMRKMCAVVSCDIRIISSQIRTDCFRMHPFKIIVGFTVRRHCQIKIPGAHIQWFQAFTHFCIGPQKFICREHSFCLCPILIHYFQPGHIFLRFPIINDMRPVHLGSRMQ